MPQILQLLVYVGLTRGFWGSWAAFCGTGAQQLMYGSNRGCCVHSLAKFFLLSWRKNLLWHLVHLVYYGNFEVRHLPPPGTPMAHFCNAQIPQRETCAPGDRVKPPAWFYRIKYIQGKVICRHVMIYVIKHHWLGIFVTSAAHEASSPGKTGPAQTL